MPDIRWEPYDGGGMNVGFHVDPADNTVTTVYQQPMDRIIAENKFRRLHEDNSARRRSGALYEIANIPVWMIQMWRNKHGVDIHDPDHFPAILQLIQSQEYAPSVMVCEGSFASKPKRTFFTGARDSASHPLASNRAQRSGGLIARGVR